jgi:COP9 signalosome complex subunit 1
LLLDIYLHQHVASLYEKVRNKALVQYFSPFASVDLNIMAQAFNTTVANLEKELSRLIMEGSIQARIDSHNKRLYARQTDQRSSTFEKTVRLGEEYQETSKAMLLRVNILRNDFVVKPQRREDMRDSKK